jgi:tyrosyl-DNA phosphodiesterase-1
VQQLNQYDFGAIRAALIASVPSKQSLIDLDSGNTTLWGWPALKTLMGQVPVRQTKEEKDHQTGHIAIQVCTLL